MTEYRIPSNCRYTESDEWVRDEGGGRMLVGVTDYAQTQLGDVVYVELPAVGTAVRTGDPFGTIESVKTVADLFAPVSGRVVEVNAALADAPEKVNEDCYGAGWLVALAAEPGAQDALLDADAYRKHVGARGDS